MPNEQELVNHFDNLCKLAALICNVPRAILVLKEESQVKLKASFGTIDDTQLHHDIALSLAVMETAGIFKQQFYGGVSLVDENGHTLGAICVSGDQPNDLNDQQREALLTLAAQVIAQLSIAKREGEILSVSALSPEIHAVLDRSGNILFINNAVQQVLGYTVEEALGMTAWQLCQADDLEMLRQQLEIGLSAGKKDFQLDFRVQSKIGLVRFISWSMVVRNDRWYAYGRDITETKRVETELLNLSFVAGKVNNAIVINDANNQVTWVNAAFESITGFTLDDLKGKRLGDLLIGPKTDVSLLENARELNRQNQSFTLDMLAYRKDKKPIWVSVYNTIIFDEAGKMTAEIDIIIDITEKKLAEQEMTEAKEQALQLSEAKEMFLSVMSHEIRTPLNAILGMTHLLLDNDPKPSQLDDLNILKFSGDNLLHIVNDVLDFTKMETGNLQLESLPFSLCLLVKDILNSLQVNAAKNHNTLDLVYDEGIPERLLGDKTRLYQVLMNLLGNALKFTENGRVVLHVKMELERQQDVVLHFQVKDNGIGIATDKQEHIFESFTQAKSDISRKYGGTGLGLAITRNLLKLFGSDIVVHSNEGQGAVFSFSISFGKIPLNITANVMDGEIPALFRNKRILVVDDNDINILIARRMLSKWGLNVDTASNGLEAIEKVKNGLFDLIFMDVTMPGMDGFEATALIREMKGDYFKTVPIIALTASTLSNENGRFKECGMNAHLLKPLNPAALKESLLQYL